jgi:hypothetical protein
MSHSLIQTSEHTNTSFFIQLPRWSRGVRSGNNGCQNVGVAEAPGAGGADAGRSGHRDIEVIEGLGCQAGGLTVVEEPVPRVCGGGGGGDGCRSPLSRTIRVTGAEGLSLIGAEALRA